MHFTTAALSALLASVALAAICKGKITKDRFPNLQAPKREGGCVRYYQGINMTGVITEQYFFFKDGFKTTCDCAAKCLEEPNNKGFNLLQAANNLQAGAPAPLTSLDAAGTIPDKFGVSGFIVQDQNGRQFC
ncbi:hypothetical protein ACKAV7_014102 [Fusarium commune]